MKQFNPNFVYSFFFSIFRSEIRKIKLQEAAKRREAQKKAQSLIQQQQMLQHQRMAQMAQAQGDPKRSGTPIIRNGKIVGYAVQVSNLNHYFNFTC